MRWVRLRLCWEWGEVGLASWVDLISLVGLVGASVASCWGLSCGQVARVVRLVPVGNEASSSVTLWRVLGALWEAIWVVAVVGLVGVSWRQVVMVGQVTRLVVDGTLVAMVGSVGGETLLWVLVAVLVVCWAMRSFKTAGTQSWVWGVLLVDRLAVFKFAASVGPFPSVSLWWVWVAGSVACWAVLGSDASVGQVTRLEANGWALMIVVGE